jgi:pheophorbide a oxygenase
LVLLLLEITNAFQISRSIPRTSMSSRARPVVLQMGESNGAWLPIGSPSEFGNIQPLQIEICGEKYAVWRSTISADQAREDKGWSVMADFCTHRLAPLSEGRIDPTSGSIECPYHGWQFNMNGTCTKIPQMDNSASSSGSKFPTASNKVSYPVTVIGDLIWSFLPLPNGQASFYPQRPDELFPEMKNYTRWTSRELPYSFDFLIENFMDPAHIPFGHTYTTVHIICF